MRHLLYITTTTGYQAGAMAAAAGRAGLRMSLASDRCDQLLDPWGDGAVAVRFGAEQRAESLAALAARAEREGAFDGVLASGDAAAVLAAHAAERFGLRFHPPVGAERGHDKLAFRRAVAAAGLAQPQFREWGAGETEFPCVVKALGFSGSRGVIRANDGGELAAAVRRLRRMVAGEAPLLVEEYLEGAEYALEGWLDEEGLRRLALFDKPDPLTGPFFEETIYVTPSRLPGGEQEAVAAAVEAAARAAGLGPGPIHAEARVRAGVVYVIEIAARPMGGLCARAVRFAQGGLEDYLVRAAVGEEVGGWRREEMAAAVMMIPIPEAGVLEGVEGVEAAAGVAGIEGVEITARLGQEIVPPPEGGTYLGFLFARTQTAGEAEAAVRSAHAKLRVRMGPPRLAVLG